MNPMAYLLIAVGIAFGGAGVGYTLTADHYQGIIAKEHLAQTQALLAWQVKANKAVTENDALKTKLGVEHAKAQADLDYLRAHPAGRVYLPRAPCAATVPQADAAGGGAIPVTGPERAADADQAALDDFKRGVESDAAEWSGALNACRPVMDWANEQRK